MPPDPATAEVPGTDAQPLIPAPHPPYAGAWPAAAPVPPPPFDPPLRPEPAPRGRRRGRTLTLLAGAAVLGVLAGTGTGYAVQQHRAPTPLPPVGLHAPLRPTGAGPASTVTAGDRTAGDLRRLLLPKPAGTVDLSATEGHDNWAPLSAIADDYDQSAREFTLLADEHFRRAAERAWSHVTGGPGDHYVEIHLYQFRDDTTSGSSAFLSTQSDYMSDPEWAGYDGSAIPGTVDGRVWTFRTFGASGTSDGPAYQARALARRGNVVIEIWYGSESPIPKQTILSLAERQLERL